MSTQSFFAESKATPSSLYLKSVKVYPSLLLSYAVTSKSIILVCKFNEKSSFFSHSVRCIISISSNPFLLVPRRLITVKGNPRTKNNPIVLNRISLLSLFHVVQTFTVHLLLCKFQKYIYLLYRIHSLTSMLSIIA